MKFIRNTICVAALFVVTAMGCGTTALAIPSEGEYTPLISIAGAMLTDGTPTPAPTPKPGKCENCGGDGKVGDGTIEVDCKVCGGDGVIEGDKPAQKPVSVLVPTPDCQCVDCKCSPCLCKPTSPAEPAKQDATKQDAKPAPVYSEPLQTPVRQTQSPRYEWRTYTQRGRFGRTSTYQRYELVDGEAAAPVYRGSMCGPNGCN